MEDHQESSTVSGVSFVALASIALYIIAVIAERTYFRVGKDEPPQVFSRIPFFGHAIGMFRYGQGEYWRRVYKRNPHPIFTINMFGQHLYMITTPGLTSQIQRGSKSLSFGAIAIELIERMSHVGGSVMSIVREKKTTTSKNVPEGSYKTKFLNLEEKAHEMQGPMLGVGSEALDDLTVGQMSKMAELLDEIPVSGQKFGLFQWLRHVVTVSNMHAVYGPSNIIARDPEMEDVFWEYENNLHLLVLGPVISPFVVPKAVAAMARLRKAMERYEETGGYEEASTWVKARCQLSLDHGVPRKAMAAFDMTLMFGILANAMPSTFWLLCYLYAHPDFLSQLRGELYAPGVLHQEEDPKAGKRICTVSLAALRNQVPLLTSAFRETLRIVGPSVSARLVLEDTIITGAEKQPFVLRKGGVCQVQGNVLHYEQEIWGPDAEQWNPRRFLQNPSGTFTQSDFSSNPGQSVHPAAYRSFGGGVSLCPGRHFAAQEITGFAAAVVLGFDMSRTDGQPFFVPPQKRDSVLPLSVGKSLQEVPIIFQRRAGFEDVIWHFTK